VEGRSGPRDDAALVAEVAAGSEAALAELYDRHVHAVHAAAMRLLGDRQAAEDVVQETFLSLWNCAERFDPAVGSLAAWIFTIARNRAVDRLRAAGRRPTLVSLPPVDASDTSDGGAFERLASERGIATGTPLVGDPAAELAATETRAAVRAAVAELPDAERTAILLAYGDGFSQGEIAARLGWPLGTVKTRTRRALARLRLVLAEVVDADLAPAPVPREAAGPAALEAATPPAADPARAGTSAPRAADPARERGLDPGGGR
jgi:RNA polymerase sigma-70 factor (ECF subfamily)